ncbi:hypothetical protein C8F04DRAFT_1085359 [Mycena alexandri]|uniref:HNH nuclease domain-containing protein n=1 Tax=Mycena alexandri TaxID=1745969 RepID=A0AAD6T654_9AGAR|nr:hypothetical protein C8F04DRAFT_1085359 [Mycena alexandri]
MEVPFIQLCLVEDFLTLTIPIASVRANSVRPQPYLRFLIFAIVGTLGDVEVAKAPVEDENVIEDETFIDVVEPRGWRKMEEDEDLVDWGVYRYADIEKNTDFPGLVRRDLNAEVSSEFETTPSRSGQDLFAEALMALAGGVCIFSEKGRTFCQASHIVRYASAHFLPIIQAHRESTDEVNDVQTSQNGLYVTLDIHKVLECFMCSVLPLPNAAMQLDDVPNKVRDRRNPDLMIGPLKNNMRYVLQQLVDPGHGIYEFIGLDAWFTTKDEVEVAFPAQHLLEYHYGVAAVIAWGGDYKEARPKLECSPPRESTSVRPQRNPRGTALNKLDKAPWRQAPQCADGPSSHSAGPSGSESTESDQLEDALDFVARLRALNPDNIVARERAEQRLKDGVTAWLQKVPVSVQ